MFNNNIHNSIHHETLHVGSRRTAQGAPCRYAAQIAAGDTAVAGIWILALLLFLLDVGERFLSLAFQNPDPWTEKAAQFTIRARTGHLAKQAFPTCGTALS